MTPMDGNILASPPPDSGAWRDLPSPNFSGAARALAVWPGAVLEFSLSGKAVAANDMGTRLLRALARQPGAPLLGLVALVGQSGGSVCDRLEVHFENARRWFECVALPGEAGRVIVLARDQTYDINVRQALFDSRQRYRDLVTISSDFAFETDKTGRFVFVSPHGALGYSPEDLIGRSPRELLVDTDVDDSELPFHTRSGVVQTQVWLRNADGEEACLMASAVPVTDHDGKWCGARGLCRDITEERLRTSELAQAKVREQVLAYVVNQIREEARPRAMLESAASMLGRATSAASAVLSYSPMEGWELSASYGEWPEDVEIDRLAEFVPRSQDAEEFENGPNRLLGRATWYHAAVNGAVLLMRDKGKRPWNDDEHAMLDAVAGQLAIGLRQIADHKELERLSTTDALTGLMNRRAFHTALEVALDRAERNGTWGTLLFIDLDNFKQINDTRGHDTGDAVLREISDILTTHSRKYDLVSRLGGDEFAVWLDDTKMQSACVRADELIAAIDRLADTYSEPGSPLGASIGLAEHLPGSGETLRSLLLRSDEAMYDAKRTGKNRWSAAQGFEPPTAGRSQDEATQGAARMDAVSRDGDQNDDQRTS